MVRGKSKICTLRDIALNLNLSISTVSRALNRDQSISIRTMNRVLDEAQKMNYFPNRAAATLRNNLTKRIGIVLSPPVTFDFLHEIDKLAMESGYLLALAIAHSDEQTALRRLEESGVDGVIFVNTYSPTEQAEVLCFSNQGNTDPLAHMWENFLTRLNENSKDNSIERPVTHFCE